MEDGRSFRYPGMFGGLDANLSSSDRIKITDEQRQVRRQEIELAALVPSLVVVEDEDVRGHIGLFRKVVEMLKPAPLYVSAAENIPKLMRYLI